MPVETVLLAWLAFAAPADAPRPAPPPVPDTLRVGLWIERRPGLDSAGARRWALDLVARLDTLVTPFPTGQHAVLAAFLLVPPGGLPLAGGDPRHHPDLRRNDLDLVRGVPVQDSLTATTAERTLRTWLVNRGCLDERGFSVAWDLFALNARSENGFRADQFPVQGQLVHSPSWSLLGGSELPLGCRRSLAAHPAGAGTLHSDQARHRRETEQALRAPLRVRLVDGLGRAASGARLELWRARPDSRRPFAGRLDGEPALLRADDSGRIALHTPLQWLADSASWVHGAEGSRGVSYWRVAWSNLRREGWMDAQELLALPLVGDSLDLTIRLPAGSSEVWREASRHWPTPWLGARLDSNDLLVVGLSLPESTECVLRVLDPRGREIQRTRPLALPAGVHERRLRLAPPPGECDIRVDSPSSRLQVRLDRSLREAPAPPGD